jgi:hypothetical protein
VVEFLVWGNLRIIAIDEFFSTIVFCLFNGSKPKAIANNKGTSQRNHDQE